MKAQPESRRGASRGAKWRVQASPRAKARMTGVMYLLFFLTAIAGEFFLRQAGISGIQPGISGNAAATANAMLAHKAFFQVGFALSLISIACYGAVTALFYQLLKPVDKSLSLIATFFSLIGLALQAFGSLFQLAPLVVLSGTAYLSVFTVKQLQALALLFLTLNTQVGSIALVFDGLFLLLLGSLIFRSTFLPRLLGGLVALAGLGWLTLLSPPLANALYTFIQVLGVLAEGSLMLWLLVIGMNGQRWIEQARTAGEPDQSGARRATG